MEKNINIQGRITDHIELNVRLGIMKAQGEKVNLHIDSSGGYVDSGMRLIDTIKNHRGGIYATVYDSAHSMASVVALSCDYLLMSRRATMNIHRPHIDGKNRESFSGYIANMLGFNELELLGIYYERLRSDANRDLLRLAISQDTTLNANQAAALFSDVYLF